VGECGECGRAVWAVELRDGARGRGRGVLVTEAARTSDAVEDARRFGVDIDQLKESLKRTPDERLRELDASMEFLGGLQGSAVSRSKRKRS